LLDRVGRTHVLLPLALGFAASCALLVACLDGPLLVAAGPAVLSGATLPPLSAAGRAAVLELVPPAGRQQGLVLDTTLMELVFVLGPPFAAALSSVSLPWAGVAGTGAIGAGGTLAFLGVSRGAVPSEAAAGGVSSLPLSAAEASEVDRSVPVAGRRGGRTLLARFVVTAALFDAAFASGNLAVLDEARGSAVPGAVLLALWAGGSMTGGLLFGLRPRRAVRLRYMVVAVSAHLAVLACVPRAELAPPVLFLGGLVIAPTLAVLFERLGAEVPLARRNEAYSWLTTGFLVGAGVGAALGGWLLGRVGVHETIAFSALSMMLAAAVAP
jgi:predicted MFS family arabinose efflux permease